MLAFALQAPAALAPESAVNDASQTPVQHNVARPLRASTLAPAHPWVPRPSASATITATLPPPTATEVELEELPEAFYINGVTSHPQWFSIGCEASAAVDWAHYFGVEINEREFQEYLPVSDNPDLGFVGDVNGPWGLIPPNDYGVHAAPVAELLRWYGLKAVARKGLSLNDIKISIANSKPVIAWVVGNVTYGNPVEYTDGEGITTVVAAYEHVVILTGYNAETIWYENNGTTYYVSDKLFLQSWGVLGNMAILAVDD